MKVFVILLLVALGTVKCDQSETAALISSEEVKSQEKSMTIREEEAKSPAEAIKSSEEDKKKEETKKIDCPSVVAGSDYIGFIFSHDDFFNKSSTYENNVDKCWHVVAELQGRVRLSIGSFHLQERMHGECVDYLEIIDGDNKQHLCGKRSLIKWESQGHEITIKFHSDSSIGNSGFLVEYNAVDFDYNIETAAFMGRFWPCVINIVIIIVTVLALAFLSAFSCYIIKMKKKQKKRRSASKEPIMGAIPHKAKKNHSTLPYPQVVLYGELPPKC